MKNRKKLIKRIGAVLCALVVLVSSMGVCVPYFASESGYDSIISLASQYGIELSQSSFIDDYKYIAFTSGVNNKLSIRGYCDDDLYFTYYVNSSQNKYMYKIIVGETYFDNNAGTKFNSHYLVSDGKVDGQMYERVNDDIICAYGGTCQILYSDYDCFNSNGGGWGDFEIYNVFRPSDSIGSSKYNPTLGYLQNVSRKSTYIRDSLYNYDEDSLTYHWYHDLQSTSGVDLTSGEYKIRHYILNAIVKGYEKEDIVEMSEKYLMAEYDASQGYFSYLQKDYLEKIESLGYIEPSWIDIYFKGYFTLQHHYFQIVNTSTNEVGGYLHLYPKDANSDEFGVEMVYEGLDDNFDVDDSLQGGIIDDSTGSGTNVEDALENTDKPKLDDLSGVQEFIGVVQAYGEEVENVSKGIGALFGELPPWVLGAIGIGFGLLVVCGVIKALG